MALEKPVMGTKVPAPALRAISSNTPRPVSSAAKNTSVSDTRGRAFSPAPQRSYKVLSPCPTAQMPPPTKKAQTRFFPMGDGLAMAAT